MAMDGVDALGPAVHSVHSVHRWRAVSCPLDPAGVDGHCLSVGLSTRGHQFQGAGGDPYGAQQI